MKLQLNRYYQIPSEKITVTGTPQFDFHRRNEYSLNRDATLSLFGLAPGERYFVYGSSPRSLTPDEPHLVEQLIQRIAQEQGLANHKIIIRLHPLDDWSRWEGKINGRNAILTGAWSAMPDANGWAFIKSEEQIKLVSLLTHADACINIASTLGLDLRF